MGKIEDEVMVEVLIKTFSPIIDDMIKIKSFLGEVGEFYYVTYRLEKNFKKKNLE